MNYRFAISSEATRVYTRLVSMTRTSVGSNRGNSKENRGFLLDDKLFTVK